jgi:hypothetical protein
MKGIIFLNIYINIYKSSYIFKLDMDYFELAHNKNSLCMTIFYVAI